MPLAIVQNTIISYGTGIHWHNIDEDINAEGMLNGLPARQLKKFKKKSRNIYFSSLCELK